MCVCVCSTKTLCVLIFIVEIIKKNNNNQFTGIARACIDRGIQYNNEVGVVYEYDWGGVNNSVEGIIARLYVGVV